MEISIPTLAHAILVHLPASAPAAQCFLTHPSSHSSEAPSTFPPRLPHGSGTPRTWHSPWHSPPHCPARPSALVCPQAGRLFDHGWTIFFSIYMSLWAVLFLEFWKQTNASLAHHWDCSKFEDIEVGPGSLQRFPKPHRPKLLGGPDAL